MLFPAGTRRRMFGFGHIGAYLRSTSPVSLDGLGSEAQPWSLPGCLERMSWSRAILLRVLLSCAHNEERDVNEGRGPGLYGL